MPPSIKGGQLITTFNKRSFAVRIYKLGNNYYGARNLPVAIAIGIVSRESTCAGVTCLLVLMTGGGRITGRAKVANVCFWL